jgi:flavodoxin
MTDDLSRRTLLSLPAVLSLAASTAACAQPAGTTGARNAVTLVAYFTRSGNTRVIAGTIQRALGATSHEIAPARPYPDDYEDTVEQARQERDRGYEPPLATRIGDFARYETVFLGFPVWGETTPPPIRSFLRAHDLSDKTLRPFITHGGYGLGSSLAVLAEFALGARIQRALVMEADQERRTIAEVKSWLGSTGA